jgi:prolyl oligopeptidase
MKVSAEAPAREKWKELVAEDDERVLDEIQIRGGHLIFSYLENAHSAMDVRKLDGTFVRKVELPTIGASFGMKGDPDRDEAYYSFMSFTTPRQIYKTSIKTGKTELWQEANVPIDASPYKVDQVWYESKDGTKVSMFLVHRKDIEMDGSTPFLLYGYGGFNVNMRPYFRSSIYPWLEAGGAYAVPNLRGGGEYGEEWHRDGMLENKQNVFDDFIAAAEHLISEGYTTSDRLAIAGGSNGGLLVGAAMTQRPDLFEAVICSVPLLDMVRYHKFGSGKTWMPEYGNPDKAEDFAYLHKYSPYHHVEKNTDYPAMLMLSADSDDRVDPMHARKFTAQVQYASSSAQPAIMRIEQNAGHGGGDMVKKYVEKYADQYAFLMQQLEVSPRSEDDTLSDDDKKSQKTTAKQ